MSPILARAISPELSRSPADTRVAELLPLLAACHFLEREAETVLGVRRQRRQGLPLWLAGVDSEIQRVPLGHILVIGPSNYPLFIPGVQVLQALVAGNAVTWKPGRCGKAVAEVFARALSRAGLPDGLLRVTDDTVDATHIALEERPDKVFFTGSADTGRLLMRILAETLTPCVMELSGCDAVVVLPSADLSRVVQALAFGMRLNGSATCMAPRRVLLMETTDARRKAFLSSLRSALFEVAPVPISDGINVQLRELMDDAVRQGARIERDQEVSGAKGVRPILILNVRPEMRIAQADVFAPVLSVIDVEGENGVLEAQQACLFALTASIFGDEREARRLASKLNVGSVLINDIIVPTADPRLPFGGRRESGFGVTRGAAGLLEMTAIRTVAVRRGRRVRHYEVTTPLHEGLFDGLIATTHGGSWPERWRGLKQMIAAGKRLTSRKKN